MLDFPAMLSRDLLRDDPERVRQSLATRNFDLSLLDRWQGLDAERRSGLVEVEELKRQRNEASREIGRLKQQGGAGNAANTAKTEEAIAAVGQLKARIESLETRQKEIEGEIGALELILPNLPHATVPVGKDESANRVERTVGEPPTFAFEPKAHWDLGPALGILDFERGAKLAGARFTVYFDAGARLERALISFMLDLHTGQHGYREVLPPFIANRETLTGTGQLPKFEQDLFKLEGLPYFLIPTAEVPLTGMHRDEILNERDLPLRYTAYTPCFRSEAGSYGKDVRGLIRQHQFSKVELVNLTTPEASYEALEQMTRSASRVLEILELPYR
ncbi:MAG TPA: serine--tRNA ligase, partial [Thermoanaerobaculia bacterium]|nr:serine--tRNA ligase [Thermoanaerobaculia bacterium]